VHLKSYAYASMLLVTSDRLDLKDSRGSVCTQHIREIDVRRRSEAAWYCG
jgi:hypothetical protein